MGSRVDSEVASCCAVVFALCTNKRLLSAVNQHVGFQMRSFVACVAALVATVGLLLIMMKLMCFLVLGLIVWFVLSLHFHGLFQSGWIGQS